MCPPFCRIAIQFSVTGHPFEFPLVKIISTNLNHLDLTLWSSDRDHGPTVFPDKAPFAIAVMVETGNSR